jgi:hypothetical protein
LENEIMAKAKMNGTQMAVLRAARGLDELTLKSIRATIFAAVKTQFRIPQTHRLSVEIDNTDAADYGVLVRKSNGQTYDDGTTPPVTYRWFLCGTGTLQAASSRWSDGVSSVSGNQFAVGSRNYITAYNGAVYVRLASTDFTQ